VESLDGAASIRSLVPVSEPAGDGRWSPPRIAATIEPATGTCGNGAAERTKKEAREKAKAIAAFGAPWQQTAIVAFRFAKERTFAERKVTIISAR